MSAYYDDEVKQPGFGLYVVMIAAVLLFFTGLSQYQWIKDLVTPSISTLNSGQNTSAAVTPRDPDAADKTATERTRVIALIGGDRSIRPSSQLTNISKKITADIQLDSNSVSGDNSQLTNVANLAPGSTSNLDNLDNINITDSSQQLAANITNDNVPNYVQITRQAAEEKELLQQKRLSLVERKVKKGETLSTIARDVYGSGNRWRELLELNPGLTEYNLRADATILVPVEKNSSNLQARR